MPAKRKTRNDDTSHEGRAKKVRGASPPVTEDTAHSVLGGLKGGYRVTGKGQKSSPGVTTYNIPFESKEIICEKRNGTEKPPSDPQQPQLIFTHGAGGGIANPATASFVNGFGNISPIVCFQGTMNLQSRVKTFHAVIEHECTSKALGGRSMGARAAVITTLESEEKAVEALILVSYPLVGASKGDLRDTILKDLDNGVDVLFITGTEDSMCDINQLNEVRKQMTAKSWLLEVAGADHGMSLKSKKAIEPIRRRTGAIAAQWLRERSRSNTYLNVSWSEETNEVLCGEWNAEKDQG